MFVLPIVSRELLVASRRRGTYWLRVLAAGLALVFGGVLLLTLPLLPSLTAAGGQIFKVLSWVGLAFALLSGAPATADCLSREKREGTLGLLFLTDLRGFDVVFGKLAAASLTVFYGIVAMLPVLAFPLILGGVTPGEYARIALVWLNSLFFSVAAGLAVSAVSRDERVAMGNSMALILAITLAVPLGGLLASRWSASTSWAEALAVITPLTACEFAFQANYIRSAPGYWASLAVTHLLGWIGLGVACAFARRDWSEAPPVSPAVSEDEELPAESPGRMAFRQSALRFNPVYWLLSQSRQVRIYPWILVAVLVAIATWGSYLGRPTMALYAVLLTAYPAHFVFKWWVANVACRSFAEERENGFFELLLSTPLTVKEILRGARASALALFGWPLLLALGLQGLVLVLKFRLMVTHEESRELALMILANAGVFLLDCWALHWVGIYEGFRYRNPQAALWKTILAVLGLPGIGIWGYLVLTSLFTGRTLLSEYTMALTLGWVVFSVGTDLYFGWRARSRLQQGLRNLVLERVTGGSHDGSRDRRNG